MAVPQPPWQERLKPTIVFILPLVLLVALAWFIRVNSDNNPMRLTMEVAEPVLIEAGIPVVPLDVTLRLQNRTREGIDVIAESQCHALRWFLLDDSGSFIQSDPMVGCQPGAIADHAAGIALWAIIRWNFAKVEKIGPTNPPADWSAPPAEGASARRT